MIRSSLKLKTQWNSPDKSGQVVIPCETPCKFFIFSYTEIHRGAQRATEKN